MATDGFPNSLTPKLAAAGCRRPDQAANNIGLLANDAASRSSLETILPTLLASLGRLPDPDLALNNLERFAQKVIDRHFLLGLFRDNPRILQLALTIFGSSQFLSDIVVRQPQLFEWLLEPGVVHRPKSKDELAEEARRVTAVGSTPDRKWSALRRNRICRSSMIAKSRMESSFSTLTAGDARKLGWLAPGRAHYTPADREVKITNAEGCSKTA